MCRNIKNLYNFDPPATDEEIHTAALQFVRKISGINTPSKNNEEVFNMAIENSVVAIKQLLNSLSTTSTKRNREIEAQKARERNVKRFSQ